MLKQISDALGRSVSDVDTLAGAIEAIALALVSRLASWCASIPNIVMVSRSAVSTFGLTWAWGLAIAVSLELVGHSLSHQWLEAKAWNMTKRKTDPTANTGLALVLMCSYFLLDFVMVGGLAFSTFSETGNPQIFIALCYPLIGVTVSIVSNERANLFRLRQAVIEERAQRKQKRSIERSQVAQVEQVERSQVVQVERSRDARMDRLLDIYTLDPQTPIAQAARELGASRTTVYAYLGALEEEGKIKKNGQGVEILTRG